MIQSDAINTVKVRFTPLNLKDPKNISDREYKKKLLVNETLHKILDINDLLMDEWTLIMQNQDGSWLPEKSKYLV